MAGSESPLLGKEKKESRTDSLGTVGPSQLSCRPVRHKDKRHVPAHISIFSLAKQLISESVNITNLTYACDCPFAYLLCVYKKKHFTHR